MGSNPVNRTIKAERAFALSAFIFWEGIRKIKCNADERCRRRLDGGELLSAQSADANESRHSDHKTAVFVMKTAVFGAYLYFYKLNIETPILSKIS